MEEIMDEFIINSVREIEFIYNKRNKDYKDSYKKREAFQKIAVNIKNLYSVDITGENVQKRWESLKDRFVREHKKLKDRKSGSGADEKLFWVFYSLLLFLEPYISHRQTKSSYFKKAELEPILNMKTARPEKFQNEESVFEACSLEACTENMSPVYTYEDVTYEDHNYSFINKKNNTESPTINPSRNPEISLESTSISQASFTTPTSKRTKARVPEWDNFAKKRKQSENIVDEQFLTSSREISAAVSNISRVIEKRTDKLADHYLPAIEESLSRVPQENRTPCLIEILKVIEKFQTK